MILYHSLNLSHRISIEQLREDQIHNTVATMHKIHMIQISGHSPPPSAAVLGGGVDGTHLPCQTEDSARWVRAFFISIHTICLVQFDFSNFAVRMVDQ
jgi:hypothetical protein